MMKAIVLQNIGGLYQDFKKGYEKTYLENTTFINNLNKVTGEDWLQYQKLGKDGQKQIEDDIKAEKSLAVIIYEVGNWLGEDCRKISNIRKRRRWKCIMKMKTK